MVGYRVGDAERSVSSSPTSVLALLTKFAELSPHARAEAGYRMRMLSTAASTMPMPQRGPSFQMVHEQRSAMYEQAQSGMPPTNQFAGGYIAARLPPPMMFHPGAIPMTGIHGPNVNSVRGFLSSLAFCAHLSCVLVGCVRCADEPPSQHELRT